MDFHTDLERWRRWCEPEHCPVCSNDQPPGDTVTLRETEFSWLEAHPRVCLPGTCYVLSKIHAVELYDLSAAALAGFMKDVQVAARALKPVTGAVKINYEIHGNTVPHLHLHLFPRAMDDPFPGQPIPTDRVVPSVYGEGGFEEFIRGMRHWFLQESESERL